MVPLVTESENERFRTRHVVEFSSESPAESPEASECSALTVGGAARPLPSHVDGQEECVMLECVLLFVLRLSCEKPLWHDCRLLIEPL